VYFRITIPVESDDLHDFVEFQAFGMALIDFFFPQFSD